MQSPNFPNEVFQVSAQPGKADCGHPKVRITKIPAKFNAKSVSTLNGRRLAEDKFGKFSTYARSDKIHIVSGYAKTRDEALALGRRMVDYIRAEARRSIEDITKLQLGCRHEIRIEERDYAD